MEKLSYTEEQVKIVKALRLKDKGAYRIAKDAKLEYELVLKIMEDFNLNRVYANTGITEEQLKQAVELKKQKKTLAEIREITGVSQATLCRHLKKTGETFPDTHSNLTFITQETLDKGVELYLSGLSAVKVKEQVGDPLLTLKILWDELEKRGIPSREAVHPKIFTNRPDDVKDIIKRYKQCEAVKWIAEVYKCAPNVITNLLKENGIKIRSSAETIGVSFADINNKKHYMRSSWEVKVAVWLDRQNIKWEYEKESFQLSDSEYTPDFWIYKEDGSLDKIVDVKGYLREENKIKIEEFKLLNSTKPFELWDEAKLKELKILETDISTIATFCADKYRKRGDFSEEELTGYIESYNKGESLKSVAKKAGCGERHLQKEFLKKGVIIRKSGYNFSRNLLSREIRKEIISTFMETKSIPETSKHLTEKHNKIITDSVVKGLLRRHQIIFE